MTIPPEAALIKNRRETTPPYMSARALAAAVTAAGTPLSASGLSCIEKGHYSAKPQTLAAIALQLGITPDELEELGRRHGRGNAVRAAALLREHIRQRVDQEPALAATEVSQPVLQALVAGVDEIRATRELTAKEQDALIRALVQSTAGHVKDEVAKLRAMVGILR